VPLPGGGTGDPGLADPLARMTANWNLVLKSQLGFNNPQTETGRFSLRNELFRVLTGPSGSARWRETLSAHVVPNILALPEFQRHCIPFSPRQATEPAIVIPFATTINFGLNFFGWPAGGGDNDYDSTKFATKVRSVGVWFANYNNLGGGMINTPRVYLVPVGLDVMRAPTQGDPYIREWRILDQALPVPFPLSAGALNDPTWIPINDSLSEDFAAIRRFGQFRAYHDSGNFNPAETITDSRLIGRSVWNTRWLLIIPAGTLHTTATRAFNGSSTAHCARMARAMAMAFRTSRSSSRPTPTPETRVHFEERIGADLHPRLRVGKGSWRAGWRSHSALRSWGRRPRRTIGTSRVSTTVYVGKHFEVRDHDQPVKYVFEGSTRIARVTGSLSGQPAGAATASADRVEPGVVGGDRRGPGRTDRERRERAGTGGERTVSAGAARRLSAG
jgi:hypothetical protein